jgi:pimeloyl-ACP methyl ester carboxylesterase
MIVPPGFRMPIPRGVLALAGIPDLSEGADADICQGAILSLLGPDPAARQARVRLTSPRSLLPLGIPQVLLCGEQDEIVPPDLAASYAQAASRTGDNVMFLTVPGAGHYELVIPHSVTWRAVCAALTALLQAR